jgi:tRNA (cmo5U34)-methyltransferase
MDLKKRAAEMKEFFDRKTDGYDDVHAKFAATKKLLTDGLEEGTERILDLGGGTGLELIPLFERFPEAEVTVIDVSPNMLEALGSRPFADRVKAVCGDFFETDFGEGWDAVISTSALHHFTPEDKQLLYRRIFDCLKPGGRFLNSDKIVFNRQEEAYCFAEYAGDPKKYAHIDTPLAPSSEVAILENAGFRRITISETDQENYRLFTAIKD